MCGKPQEKNEVMVLHHLNTWKYFVYRLFSFNNIEIHFQRNSACVLSWKKNLFCCMKDIFEFFTLLPVTVLPMEVLDLYIAVKNELTVSKVVTGAKTHPENA